MKTHTAAVRERAQAKLDIVARLTKGRLSAADQGMVSLLFDAADQDIQTIEWLKSPLGQHEAQAQARLKLRQIEAEQRADVMHYLRTGQIKGLAGQGDTASVLLPVSLHGEVVEAANGAWAMRKLSRNITITTSAIDIAVRAKPLDDAEWTALLDTSGEDTSKPYAVEHVEPQFLVKRLKVSRALLRKGGRLAEEEIITAITDATAKPIEYAAINGNGALKPLGLLNTPELPSYTTASSGALSIADAKRWVGRLAARYHAGATALMHGDTYSALLELDTAGALFQQGKLVGRYPIELSDEFPSAGTNPASLAGGVPIAVLGDFHNFWFIDSLFEIQRLDDLYAETNDVGFIARCEVDAVCTRPEAFQALVVKA